MGCVENVTQVLELFSNSSRATLDLASRRLTRRDSSRFVEKRTSLRNRELENADRDARCDTFNTRRTRTIRNLELDDLKIKFVFQFFREKRKHEMFRTFSRELEARASEARTRWFAILFTSSVLCTGTKNRTRA